MNANLGMAYEYLNAIEFVRLHRAARVLVERFGTGDLGRYGRLHIVAFADDDGTLDFATIADDNDAADYHQSGVIVATFQTLPPGKTAQNIAADIARNGSVSFATVHRMHAMRKLDVALVAIAAKYQTIMDELLDGTYPDDDAKKRAHNTASLVAMHSARLSDTKGRLCEFAFEPNRDEMVLETLERITQIAGDVCDALAKLDDYGSNPIAPADVANIAADAEFEAAKLPIVWINRGRIARLGRDDVLRAAQQAVKLMKDAVYALREVGFASQLLTKRIKWMEKALMTDLYLFVGNLSEAEARARAKFAGVLYETQTLVNEFVTSMLQGMQRAIADQETDENAAVARALVESAQNYAYSATLAWETAVWQTASNDD